MQFHKYCVEPTRGGRVHPTPARPPPVSQHWKRRFLLPNAAELTDRIIGVKTSDAVLHLQLENYWL